jgi:hypothetical protein
MIQVTPQLLRSLDIVGLVLNFIGGLLLAYDLFSETKKAVAEQETMKLETMKKAHEFKVGSYTKTLTRENLPAELGAIYQAELDEANKIYSEWEKEITEKIKRARGHADRAVLLGSIGIVIIITGFLLQLIKAWLS